MSGEHPFQHLFESFGKLPSAHTDSVNREARETLKGLLSVAADKPGRCILLKAPRAGHGKTHLLARLQHELVGTHEFIPLHATGGSRIDASTALDDTLRCLVRALPAAGGLTALDLLVRRLFSSALQPLVNSGEVPCQDREGALTALRIRPIETFDFHHPAAVTAHWARENFELLGPRLSLELAQRNGLPLREVSFWVETMFRFAATPIDNPGRARALAAAVFESQSAESAAHERLVALLGLLGSLTRVILVADELEGFSSDEAAALRFASFIGSLRQSVERADFIISVNQDVWESAFLPRLSGGLADRLSEITVELEPLDRAGVLAIIESRSPGMGEEILAVIEHGGLPSHARGIIRKAADSWGLEPKSVPAAPKPEPAPYVPPAAAREPGSFIPPVAAPAPAPLSPPVEATELSPFFPPVLAPEPAPERSPYFPPVSSPESAVFVPAAEQSPAFAPPPEPAPPVAEFSPPVAEFTPSVTEFTPPVAEFAPPVSVPAPPVAEPSDPFDSFDAPTRFSPEAAIAAFNSTSQPEPAHVPQPAPVPVESPFIIDTEAESAMRLPDPSPPVMTAAEEPGQVSTDRVDDLLRQFRERYGKG